MSTPQAIMFDLDGTLADTLAPIAEAGNHALKALGRPTFAPAAYRHLAGQGLEALIAEAIGPDHPELFAEGLKIYREYYARHGMADTRAYPGILDLLAELTRRRLRLAVLSNKIQFFVEECVQALFPNISFAAVVGHGPGTALKPDPGAALAIARQLHIEAAAWVYVGDTAVDMQTGRGAGMFTVGVTWGFRDEAELRANGAQAIIHQPMELIRWVELGIRS
ncbi:MAG: HAD family hydrolase [Phycisphaeraceae bacterium]|nr:HAD family hydrolase [Phycisphaeraceae bacterium]